MIPSSILIIMWVSVGLYGRLAGWLVWVAELLAPRLAGRCGWVTGLGGWVAGFQAAPGEAGWPSWSSGAACDRTCVKISTKRDL